MIFLAWYVFYALMIFCTFIVLRRFSCAYRYCIYLRNKKNDVDDRNMTKEKHKFVNNRETTLFRSLDTYRISNCSVYLQGGPKK